MAKFHTTAGIAHEIESLIKEAEKEIILVSPYLQIHKLVMQRLIDAAAHKNVSITIVYRIDAKNTKAEVEKLKAIESASIYAIENLHAKCFMNEKSMLLTSMNLYDYSEKNNREMGIALSLSTDRQIYKQAAEEVHSIIRASTLIKEGIKPKVVENKTAKDILFKSTKTHTTSNNQGYCIRCGDRIRHNVNAPFCKDCFNTWVEFENINYREKYCHTCEKPYGTSMNSPQCNSCKKTYSRQAAW